MFSHLLRLSYGWHVGKKTGETLQIVGRGQSLNGLFDFFLFTLLPVIFSLVTSWSLVAWRFGAETFFMLCTVLLAYSIVYSLKLRKTRVLRAAANARRTVSFSLLLASPGLDLTRP